jgi:hypothetical protein
MTTNANTPEKSTTGDNCPWCGSHKLGTGFAFTCGSDNPEQTGSYWQSPLCRALEARNESEQEANTLLNLNNIKAERITELEAELAEVKKELAKLK